MVDLYNAVETPVQKALVFRAYTTFGCGGGCNELFSGDGYTYTGNGGFLGGTGQELHTGLAGFDAFKSNLKVVFFCPYNNFNNQANPGSICDAATYGTCTSADCARYEVGA
jgi:hypothetical protein